MFDVTQLEYRNPTWSKWGSWGEQAGGGVVSIGGKNIGYDIWIRLRFEESDLYRVRYEKTDYEYVLKLGSLECPCGFCTEWKEGWAKKLKTVVTDTESDREVIFGGGKPKP